MKQILEFLLMLLLMLYHSQNDSISRHYENYHIYVVEFANN